MANSTITVDFSCPCGGKLETKDDIRTDASMVSCKVCGKEFGTFGEVMAEGRKRATDKGREIFQAEINKITSRSTRLSR